MKFWNSFTLILLFAFSASTSLFAVVSPTNDDTKTTINLQELVDKAFPADATLTKKANEEKARLEKAITKVEKRMKKVNARRALKGKAGVDFNDPVQKWMWFWIFGWAAAIVLSVLATVIAVGTLGSGFGVSAILILVGWLAGLFGTVSLIIWLVKKFS